ncbi:discoidin, CUB and LCCL domain-containing protein 1 [Chanos chanos]|uniref:Discoidin, CUB and LCCL domain-containing protein 1 n=1 Tax=Chanos chanos TaxID=29144 RepID=A0A6J2W3D4_CHACN|nr:discoidin, CUB and LCCL domain-containing protein 1-like [Chanos chanos]
MLATPGSHCDAIDLFIAFWCILNFETLLVYGQEGNGCGHTVLSSKSGTLTSRNYPGTYPNNTHCEWRLRVPQGHTLRLVFGDFNLEWSRDCAAGSLTITDSGGAIRLGPLCGQLDASLRNVSLNTNEVTVRFMSGLHRSGRGFLMSYSTNQHSDLISCLQKGIHFYSESFSVSCPAGCKNVTGQIWGHYEQGYRDTSVLCKAAIHAGVISDSQGGVVTVSQRRGITLYESSFANGILSSMGSLSDKRLLFHKDCSSHLTASAYNASSVWQETDSTGQRVSWSPGRRGAGGEVFPWAGRTEDKKPWLEIELWNRSSVTGIITKGTADFYLQSYTLSFSKDGKTWKVYKAASSKEKKVFEAHSDGHLSVLNSLFPPVVARYLLLKPQNWHVRPSADIQVLGCPSGALRPRSNDPGSTFRKGVVTEMVLGDSVVTEGPLIIKSFSNSDYLVTVAVSVVLGLTLCVGCLLAVIWCRRRAETMKKGCIDEEYKGFHGKKLPCPSSELISYPLTRNVHDSLPDPPLNDYAEPDVLVVGQKLGSTFRPTMEDGYTVPFILNHYDTPGKIPEYAEPLPPEPEYATPFTEQSSETLHNKHRRPLNPRTNAGQPQYDSPAQRLPSNSYSSPLSAGPMCQVTTIYVEPEPVDPLLQHIYHEPL